MPNNEITQLKWEVRQRLTLIEALAFWRGEFSTADIIDVFGIARSQASKDLALYQRLFPDNLIYQRIAKRYQPSESFSPGLIKGDTQELLHLTRAAVHDQAGAVLLRFPSIALVEPVERKTPFDILRAINTAIRRRQVLRIAYQSMSRTRHAEHRIAPHTLVHNGFRWHVRAYSFGHAAYRDFVLSRFAHKPDCVDSLAYQSSEDDQAWNTWVNIELAPNPALSLDQQHVIAEDFGMQEQALSIPLRGALLGYFLRVMGLSLDVDPTPSPEHPIIVSNPADIAPFNWS
jgi:predicted DNA-binding transcriptional regulator YafY